MRKLLSIILALCIALGASAQSKSTVEIIPTGDNGAAVKDINISKFNKIRANGGGKIIFKQDKKKYSITAKVTNKVVKVLKLKNNNGTLEITYEPKSTKPTVRTIKSGESLTYEKKANEENEVYTLYISAPDLTSVSLNGNAEFEAKRIKTSDMSISLNGSCEVDINTLTCSKLTNDVNGDCDIDIKDAKCTEIHNTVNGISDIHLSTKSAETILSNVKGNGELDLNVSHAQQLSVEIFGNGSCNLKSSDVAKTNLSVRGDGQINANIKGRSDIITKVKGKGHIALSQDSKKTIIKDND